MSTLHSEAQISVASTSQTDSILVINGKKAVATKNLILGFGITKANFEMMWKRNQDEFIQGKDWDWCDLDSQQIVSYRKPPKTARIFWTTGVSKASTKFNSVKAKEFAQKMFDNYGSQLDGETKLVKNEPQNTFNLPQSYEQALEDLLKKVRQNTQLTLENEELKPKADYFDIVVNQNPENLTVVETTSRFLNQEKGIKISYVKVWEIMRDEKWLIYQKKHANSQSAKIPFPAQKSKNEGWLTTTENKQKGFSKEGAEVEFVNTQILITPIGRLELLKLVQKFINNQSQNLI